MKTELRRIQHEINAEFANQGDRAVESALNQINSTLHEAIVSLLKKPPIWLDWLDMIKADRDRIHPSDEELMQLYDRLIEELDQLLLNK